MYTLMKKAVRFVGKPVSVAGLCPRASKANFTGHVASVSPILSLVLTVAPTYTWHITSKYTVIENELGAPGSLVLMQSAAARPPLL